MQTVSISTFPLPLSAFCLGTASFGSAGLTGEPLDKAFSILDAYYAMDGRFLDTANVYGRWGVDHINASELVIGRWLKERQISDMVITTKACHYMPENPTVSRVTAADMARDVEESRRSLGLDVLPICLLHRDNRDVDIRTIVDFCVSQVDCGNVLRFGFSNYTAGRVEKALDYLGADWQRYFVGVSNEWSLAMEGATDYTPPDGMVATDRALRELARDRGFVLLPFSSVAHGFFAKLERCGAVYENGAWSHVEDFTGKRDWLTAKNGEAYRRLLDAVKETGLSVNTLSLRYLMEQPGVVPVMSVSKPEQLVEMNNEKSL